MWLTALVGMAMTILFPFLFGERDCGFDKDTHGSVFWVLPCLPFLTVDGLPSLATGLSFFLFSFSGARSGVWC